MSCGEETRQVNDRKTRGDTEGFARIWAMIRSPAFHVALTKSLAASWKLIGTGGTVGFRPHNT